MVSRIALRGLAGLGVLLAGWACLTLFPEAVAQPDPAKGVDPYRAAVPQMPSPYWGYTMNPYASYLHGVADVTRANSEYYINIGQAALIREQVRAVKLEYRKKELEQWAWERDFKDATFERERERMHVREVERSRRDPPASEILGAAILNTLFKELRALDLPGESTPIDPEWLLHIHVTSPAGGNPGLLKSERIFWPLMLRTAVFEAERTQVEGLLKRVRLQAAGKGVAAEEIFLLRELLQTLRTRADNAARGVGVAGAWSMGDSIRVDRFLRELHSSIQLLELPETAFYLQPLQGKTVAEVVAHMKRHGLQFAPATVGAERFDVAFHRALADELTRVRPTTTPRSESR